MVRHTMKDIAPEPGGLLLYVINDATVDSRKTDSVEKQ